MKRYRGTFDIFFGIQHRKRKEEMEEQFNKETKHLNSNDERIKLKLVFWCVSLRAWWSGLGDAKFEESFSTRRVDAVPNSQVQQRTVMTGGDTEGGMMVDWSRLLLWAATLHSDGESRRLRPWTSSTRHGNSDSHKSSANS